MLGGQERPCIQTVETYLTRIRPLYQRHSAARRTALLSATLCSLPPVFGGSSGDRSPAHIVLHIADISGHWERAKHLLVMFESI